MKTYVIYVTTGREAKVYRELKKRGFKAVLPEEMEMGKNGKPYKKVVFPNYVFLRCEMTDKIYCEIRSMRNVKYFLGFYGGGVGYLREDEERYIEEYVQ